MTKADNIWYNYSTGGAKMGKKMQKLVIILMLLGLLGSSIAFSVYYIISAQ